MRASMTKAAVPERLLTKHCPEIEDLASSLQTLIDKAVAGMAPRRIFKQQGTDK